MTQGNELKSLRHQQAWVRFLARYIDVFLFSIIFWIIYYLVFAKYVVVSSATDLDIVANVAILFIWVFVETLLLSTVGTTLGKSLLNISLRDNNGKKLILINAFRRSFTVFLFGLFAGLPLFSFVALLYSYLAFTKNGVTKWDQDNACQLTYKKISIFRLIILVLILSISIILIIMNAIHALSS